MKNKLFAVVLVVSFYVLFIFAFAETNNPGNVTQFLSDLELSDATAIAVALNGQRPSGAELEIKADFRDPMPPPLKKPKPRRKKRKRR
ncbi:MAG: hypothetical protein ACE5IY_03365 [bacterium]